MPPKPDQSPPSADRQPAIGKAHYAPSPAGVTPAPRYEQDYAGHYLHSTPSPVPGIAGLLIAFGLIAFGISEVRTAASRQSSLQVAPPGSAVAANAAMLKVAAETWTLNGEPVEQNDLLFRLTGAAGRSSIIIIEHAPGISATRLTRALELVNQAGFTQVGVRAMAAPANLDTP